MPSFLQQTQNREREKESEMTEWLTCGNPQGFPVYCMDIHLYSIFSTSPSVIEASYYCKGKEWDRKLKMLTILIYIPPSFLRFPSVWRVIQLSNSHFLKLPTAHYTQRCVPSQIPSQVKTPQIVVSIAAGTIRVHAQLMQAFLLFSYRSSMVVALVMVNDDFSSFSRSSGGGCMWQTWTWCVQQNSMLLPAPLFPTSHIYIDSQLWLFGIGVCWKNGRGR